MGSLDSGACRIVDCDEGWEDCDGRVTNGCETRLDTLTDCGGCDLRCDPTNGTGSCTFGTCDLATCDAGWEDCDGDVTNGCEGSLDSPASCGDCRRTCDVANATTVCADRSCAFDECEVGYASCDGDLTTGCEVSHLSTDPTDQCGLSLDTFAGAFDGDVEGGSPWCSRNKG